MLYSKLPVVLLSTLANQPESSTNCHIAKYLLVHMDEIQTISISELAADCSVSNSSISRFCREIGLSDFTELKELLSTSYRTYEMVSMESHARNRLMSYADQSASAVRLVAQTLDLKKVHHLCRDIDHYENIYLFGLMKAGSVAANLHSDLLMLGKVTNCKLPYEQQIECITQADKNDLILIFSYTGTYFEYSSIYSTLAFSTNKPRIYMITGNTAMKPDRILYDVITFASPQTPVAHPCQLQAAAEIIAQEYAYMHSQDRPV
jgi:DNA-binding MurR/RpiR family transcriptional regulator